MVCACGLELTLVPAGEFTMGGNEGDDDEKPPHTVYLDAFHIGKYPITNAQYKCFVDAAGHESPEHWLSGSLPEGKEAHPVVNVSWDDARTCCRWMTEHTGRIHRLPTEAEWEKAASWDPGTGAKHKYPWGARFDKDKCNTEESRIGTTTPAGNYSPSGESPYGVADMAGNVWEWTSTLYADYPYDAHDGREDLQAVGDRLVRGGSFINPRRSVRCACRLRVNPDVTVVSVGFRVVLAASSPV